MEERCVRESLFKYDDSNKSCKWKNAVEERFLYNSLDNFKQKSQKELSWLLMFKSTSMLKSTGGGYSGSIIVICVNSF